jgi:DNA primase
MAKAPAKASAKKQTTLLLAGREVTVTNPDKVYFPTAGHTKLDLVRYYVEVAEGALRGIAGRPIVMKRYVDGADKPAFYQKRAPEHAGLCCRVVSEDGGFGHQSLTETDALAVLQINGGK